MPLVAQAKQPRILAIDFVRIFVIAAVIAAHLVAYGPFYDSQTAGITWMFVHTSRNIFFLLMALVLTYSLRDGRYKNARSFYARRFPLVVIPYALWTAIYMLYNHGTYTGDSPFGVAMDYGWNLLTSNAMYHLYFLLVTMQLYVFFPLLHKVVPLLRRYPLQIFGVSLAVQLLFTALMHYNVTTKSWLDWWLQNPDKFVLSYQFYLVAGMVIAVNFQRFADWIRRWRPVLFCSTIAVAIGAIMLYGSRALNGVSPESAADTFQPYLVIESLAFTLTLFAAGLAWQDRGARFRSMVALVAEDSFGIYLAHLIVLVPLVNHLQPQAGDWLTVTLSIIVGVPFVYLLTLILAELLRHTPFSLAFTGRKRSKQSFVQQFRGLRKLKQEIDTAS